MTKWIIDHPSDPTSPTPINCTEVHGSHSQSHTILSGNPTFKVRLSIAWTDVRVAICRLLGKPNKWPHQNTIFGGGDFNSDILYAVSAEIVNDQGAATSDTDNEILNYNNALVDVTYMPRKGIYVHDANNQDVYWEDEIQYRYETRPMDHTKLIWGMTSTSVPVDKIVLHPNEAPIQNVTGYTLVHTIEGWCRDIPDTGAIPGTVNKDPYNSVIVNKNFAAGTLLLRTITVSQSFSFRSYREIGHTYGPHSSPVVSPGSGNWEMSGRPTNTLKLSYEYKKEGWEKFYRNHINPASSGFYYIRQNASPHDKVTPFPEAEHHIYLGNS